MGLKNQGSKIIPFHKKKQYKFSEVWLNFVQFEREYNELWTNMISVAQSEGELLDMMNSKDFKDLIDMRLNNLIALKEKQFDEYIWMPIQKRIIS